MVSLFAFAVFNALTIDTMDSDVGTLPVVYKEFKRYTFRCN